MTIQDALTNKLISQETLDNIQLWLGDERYKEFLEEINAAIESGKWLELENAFYKRIAIGTGGIRGPIGFGPNSINKRTIGEAAQGLSQFIHDFGEDAVSGGVVIGYDARKLAKEFAEISAEVFAANGTPVYIFDSLRATPEISFAVRHLKATAGVMITASHNPRTDNGFKFYWSDGAQVVPPHDAKFMQLVTSVTDIARMPLEEAKQKGLVKVIGAEIDKAYLQKISELSLVDSTSAKVVFSPMHGSGSTNVLPVLKQKGFNVVVVPEQAEPDENFPTAHGDLINPQFPEVMALSVALGEKEQADVVIVSDPDADRAALAAPDKQGRFRLYSGDEAGAMMTHFILSQRKLKGTLPSEGIVLETYVTTTLISDIAKSFGVRVVDDLLVGFKYIAEIIEKLDDPNNFIFAAEESIGYLAGSFCRDKDGAIAGLILAELASFLKDNNQTFDEYLYSLGNQYGFYENRLHTLDMSGRQGSEQLFQIMTGMRMTPPIELGSLPVLKVIDRLPEVQRDPSKYIVGKTGDQVSLILSEDDKSRITVRPSGTEPIIKLYIQHYSKHQDGLVEEANRLEEDIVKYVKGLIKKSD